MMGGTGSGRRGKKQSLEEQILKEAIKKIKEMARDPGKLQVMEEFCQAIEPLWPRWGYWNMIISATASAFFRPEKAVRKVAA